VRRLAAAFSPASLQAGLKSHLLRASLLPGNCAHNRDSREKARGEESGRKRPHSIKASHPGPSRERLKHDLVDVTPSPILARLKRSHNRMLGLSEVLRGVSVLRGIAAADVTTNLAQAQMNPRIAHFQTLLASVGFW
jgi:hypothetical protein